MRNALGCFSWCNSISGMARPTSRQITVARRMIRARIEAAVSGALRGPWTQFTGLFEELLDRLPRRHQASEQLERLLAWFKELQERVEAAYLKATGAINPVENTDKNDAQVMKKTQEMNPREFISEPHILTTNQLIPDPVYRYPTRHRCDCLREPAAGDAGRIGRL